MSGRRARAPPRPLLQTDAVLRGLAEDFLADGATEPLSADAACDLRREHSCLWEFSGLRGDGWAPLRHSALINKP